jgi:predicted Zn-dependent protease
MTLEQEKLADLYQKNILLNFINNELRERAKIQEIQKDTLTKIATVNVQGKPAGRDTKSVSFVMVCAVIAVVVLVGVVSYSHTSSQKENGESLKSKYVIENLQGDTVDTWLHWNLVQGRTIGVNILNTDTISQEKLDAIKAVILSNDSILLDDSLVHKGLPGSTSTYYAGWSGALKQASKTPTKYYIPTEFVILESAKGEGDITIDLVTYKDSDGYSGYTKSVTEQQQILKSHITIYDVDSLSAEQIGTILRHEFGHALGLAHSTAPEDLMAPVISTPYPYISECDIAAISALYDGNESSQVICEK